MRPAVDTTLGEGRYRLEQRLGAGGMATVWLALDERLERPVAVKIVADTLAGDEHWLRRFRREARAAARLSHPGVVPVFDYGVEEGRPYLVMEYVPGGTLAGRLAGGTSPAPAPDQVARELLEALEAVHSAGILHRDIKPANLLLDEHDRVRLTDFGIAQPQDATALTRTGMVVGSLRYLAPEVAAGGPATVRSDLYSAGVVVREAAGTEPAAALAELIAALTAGDPERRPDSAAAARELLTAGSRDATAETRPHRADTVTRPLLAGEYSRPLPRSRLRPGLLAAAAIAVVVVAILVIILATSGGGSPPPKVPAPAPARAGVGAQVQALQRIVDSATHP
jgi:eukaryotic-like serine/threonine-protein kinase